MKWGVSLCFRDRLEKLVLTVQRNRNFFSVLALFFHLSLHKTGLLISIKIIFIHINFDPPPASVEVPKLLVQEGLRFFSVSGCFYSYPALFYGGPMMVCHLCSSYHDPLQH